MWLGSGLRLFVPRSSGREVGMNPSIRRNLIRCSVTILLGLAIGMSLAVVWRDSTDVFMAAMTLGVCFSIPCLVLGLWMRNDRNNVWPQRVVPWVFAMTLMPLGVVPCSQVAWNFEIGLPNCTRSAA